MSALPSSEYVVSLSIMKTHLGMVNFDDHDSWLDGALASITKKVETYCKRKFKAAGYTEYHNGNGRTGYVYIDHPPIESGQISEINEDVNRDFANSTKYATSAYIIYNDEGRIELLNIADVISTELSPVVFSKGQQNIKVTYTGGYEAIPEDLQYGVKEWVSRLYKRRDKKRWGISSTSKGDTTVSYESFGEMPKDAKEFIHPYRLFRLGRRA